VPFYKAPRSKYAKCICNIMAIGGLHPKTDLDMFNCLSSSVIQKPLQN